MNKEIKKKHELEDFYIAEQLKLATHAGILLGVPTIGVAKSYYKVENADYTEPENQVFAYEDIVIQGEIYGRVLRTHKNVRPIFLSVGNRIDMETAMEVTKHFVTKESHIPMPTRCADIMTHEIRKECQHKMEDEVLGQ